MHESISLHPRPQGYPIFLNAVTCPIFLLTIWIGGPGDEDDFAQVRGSFTASHAQISSRH